MNVNGFERRFISIAERQELHPQRLADILTGTGIRLYLLHLAVMSFSAGNWTLVSISVLHSHCHSDTDYTLSLLALSLHCYALLHLTALRCVNYSLHLFAWLDCHHAPVHCTYSLWKIALRASGFSDRMCHISFFSKCWMFSAGRLEKVRSMEAIVGWLIGLASGWWL